MPSDLELLLKIAVDPSNAKAGTAECAHAVTAANRQVKGNFVDVNATVEKLRAQYKGLQADIVKLQALPFLTGEQAEALQAEEASFRPHGVETEEAHPKSWDEEGAAQTAQRGAQEYSRGYTNVLKVQGQELTKLRALYPSLTMAQLALVPAVQQGTSAIQKQIDAARQHSSTLLSLNDALAGTKTWLQAMSGEMEVAAQFQQKFGSAMGQSVAQAIVYADSVGKAMDAALKATLASIAGQAMVRAIFETAVGFADLFVDPPAAAAAFESAAIFAAVGGAAAAVGAAVPGGGRGSARGGSRGAASGAGASGGYGPGRGRNTSTGSEGSPAAGYNEYGAGVGSALATGASPAAQPSGGLTVSIMGDEEAGQWLATTLNRAVTQGGVQLTATGSQRGAPVGH